MDLVLASSSPRRRELMARVHPRFLVTPVDVDESRVPETDPIRFAMTAAVWKARAAAPSFPDAVVIGADTVVSLDGRIFGKPRDRAEARTMLRDLSGRTHSVITGVAFVRLAPARILVDREITSVTFWPLPDVAIESYLDRGDHLDKAGAYAIQDIGETFIAAVEGDTDNVVGFPVRLVSEMLDRFSIEPFSSP